MFGVLATSQRWGLLFFGPLELSESEFCHSLIEKPNKPKKFGWILVNYNKMDQVSFFKSNTIYLEYFPRHSKNFLKFRVGVLDLV